MNERLKKLRKTLDLTQQEFADKISVKRNTVATYEMGRSEPSDAAVSLICREFNVNEEWLRTGNGEMFLELDREDEIAAWAGKLLHPGNDGSFQQRFIHMLSKLGEEDWKVLEKMALLMADENKKD